MLKYSAGVCTECGKTSFIVSHKGGKEICGKCNKARLKTLKDARGTNVPPKGEKPVKSDPNSLKYALDKKEYDAALQMADKWFSRFIRIRDAKLVHGYYISECCTCGKKSHPKNLECAHYITRGCMSTRFNEVSCGSQDTYCNRDLAGAKDKHAEYIKQTYGEDKYYELQRLKSVKVDYKPEDLRAIAKEYRHKANKLAAEKDLKWWA